MPYPASVHSLSNYKLFNYITQLDVTTSLVALPNIVTGLELRMQDVQHIARDVSVTVAIELPPEHYARQ